jgi:hypothetical protein
MLKIVGSTVIGKDTKFLSLKKGDKVRPGKCADGYTIKSITSNTEAVISETNQITSNEEFQTYDILRSVDQSGVN